jgi:hypothetical protein
VAAVFGLTPRVHVFIGYQQRLRHLQKLGIVNRFADAPGIQRVRSATVRIPKA